MKQLLRSKLTRKVFILVFLLGGLAFVLTSSSNVQPVAALACCYDCDAGADDCAQNYVAYGYSSVYACMQGTGVNYCYRHCTYDCDGGGPRYCQFETQCPPGQFCVGGICQ